MLQFRLNKVSNTFGNVMILLAILSWKTATSPMSLQHPMNKAWLKQAEDKIIMFQLLCDLKQKIMHHFLDCVIFCNSL